MFFFLALAWMFGTYRVFIELALLVVYRSFAFPRTNGGLPCMRGLLSGTKLDDIAILVKFKVRLKKYAPFIA